MAQRRDVFDPTDRRGAGSRGARPREERGDRLGPLFGAPSMALCLSSVSLVRTVVDGTASQWQLLHREV